MDVVNYALSKKIKRYIDDISSSNQVQSDWNQNDESAPDYVKGRTHYMKTNTVLEYGVLSGFEDNGDGMYAYLLPYVLDIYDGSKVEVTWDNQVYQLTAIHTHDESSIFIGNNIFLGGEDSGEPFGIAISEQNGEAIIISTSTEASHEVGIVAESPVKIKPYFLPSNIAYLQNGLIPLNLVIPNDYDIFGMHIAAGYNESTLENPYPNKIVLDRLTLETFNAMLDGTVSLPKYVLINLKDIASVKINPGDRLIRVLWSECNTYSIQNYDLAGAFIKICQVKIHEDADNPGTIVSEYAVITVADKRLT